MGTDPVGASGKTYVIFPGDNNKVYVKNAYGAVIIDINGTNEPNTDGKDRFVLRFNESGIAWDNEVAESGEDEEGD